LKESLKIHPTPATSEVVLGYTLRQSRRVHLSLVDPLGRRIHEIFDDRRSGGHHTMTIPLDGLAPGLYFRKMSTEAGVQVARMVVPVTTVSSNCNRRRLHYRNSQGVATGSSGLELRQSRRDCAC
jgi:hypothetical protein